MTANFEWLDLEAPAEQLLQLLGEPPVPVTNGEFLDLAQLVESESRRRGDEEMRMGALQHVADAALRMGLREPAESALVSLAGSSVDDPLVRARAHRELGRIRLDEDFDVGLHHLLEARQILSECAEGEPYVLVSLQIGHALGGFGDRERALQFFADAGQVARSIGRADLVMRAEDRLAAAEWELGRAGRAEDHLRRALDIADALGDQGEIGFASFRLGWKLADDLQSSASRRDEALHLLGVARSVAQEQGNLGLVAACDEKAAWVKADEADYSAAIQLISAAISVFDATGDSNGALIARANLAGYLDDVGDRDGCVRTLRSVVHDAQQLENDYLVATASTRLARRLTELGRPEEASSLLDSCAPYFESDDNRVEGVRFLLARSHLYNHLNLLEATRETAQKVLASIERSVLPSFHAEALEYLADCALADGDRLRAESLFGQAVALYLVDENKDAAMRVASRILPGPGEKVTDLVAPDLWTGQYL